MSDLIVATLTSTTRTATVTALPARIRPAIVTALATPIRPAIVAAAMLLAACGPAPPGAIPECGPLGVCGYRVVERYPHDPEAFTQGLIYHGGYLYEGTGLNGESTLRQVELETGRVLQQVALDPQYFGEGITIFGDSLLQLTFMSGIGFIYDAEGFERRGEFSYPGEGWGLTHDSSRLIMSDGTAELRLLDPPTFNELERIEVTEAGAPVDRLNELEFIEGELYANVWQTDRIARISLQTGQVVGWIDLTGLLGSDRFAPGVDVLNGIAYDAEGGRLFVTGKRWPWLYEIELIPPD